MEEGLKTIAMSEAQRQAVIRTQLQEVDVESKDQDVAFLIELLGGIVGFLGIGYIYAGLTNAGLVRLVGFWIALIIAWSAFGLFTVVTLGFGGCLAPLMFIPQVVIAFLSANDLKKSLVAVKSDPLTSVAPRKVVSVDPDEEELV